MTPIETIRRATDEEIGLNPRARSKWKETAKEVDQIIGADAVAALQISGGKNEVLNTISGLRSQLFRIHPNGFMMYTKSIQDIGYPDKYTLLISGKPFVRK